MLWKSEDAIDTGSVLDEFWILCLHAKSLQSCSTLCDPMDCSLPGSSVCEILQAKILEWVAMSSSRGSSDPGIKPTSRVSPAVAGVFFFFFFFLPLVPRALWSCKISVKIEKKNVNTVVWFHFSCSDRDISAQMANCLCSRISPSPLFELVVFVSYGPFYPQFSDVWLWLLYWSLYFKIMSKQIFFFSLLPVNLLCSTQI